MSTQDDLFTTQRVAMQLVVPYDLALAVFHRIASVGGHVAVMERQHKRGQYRLTVNLPSSIAHTFTQYETKS